MELKKYEFIELFKLNNVPIRFHWSTSLILFLILITAVSNTQFPISVFAFLIIVISHELGHMWFAYKLNLKSIKIDIYPIGGTCQHEVANTEYENTLIAWGGVVFQAIIFIPTLIFSYFFADTSPQYIKDILYYLGTINLIIALFNLLPIPPLDGATCWRWIPLYLKYGSIKKPKENISDYQKKFDKR